jgi:DNA-binding NarL/FixJ family response regulator
MLALVVARPGPVNDGLVALLEAAPQVRKIAHVWTANDAWDFVNKVCPDITLVHAVTLSQELATFMADYKAACSSPLLVIVLSEEERQMALAYGADIVVIEGLPASKLSAHLANLLHQSEV